MVYWWSTTGITSLVVKAENLAYKLAKDSFFNCLNTLEFYIFIPYKTLSHNYPISVLITLNSLAINLLNNYKLVSFFKMDSVEV